MKYKISFLFVLSLLNTFSEAQTIRKKDLIGKWEMTAVSGKKDSILYFDRFAEYALSELRQKKPDYSIEDSIKAVEKVKYAVDELKKKYEFKRNNRFTTTIASRSNGHFKLKKNMLELHSGKRVDIYEVEIKNGLLSMKVTTAEFKSLTFWFKKL